MDAWNFVLQLHDPFARPSTDDCTRFSVPGLPRPCRVLIYVCDSAATSLAKRTHVEIDTALGSRVGATTNVCNGPGMWGCMTWEETSCLQILVPIVGTRLSPSVETEIRNWLSQAGRLAIVLPALMPGLGHDTAFAGCSEIVSRLNSVSAVGGPNHLATLIMQRAFSYEKPGLFISYRRSEAGALVDQLYDEFGRRGFRVFLDRFSGSPGRCFPEELAEEMADKAVLLVIETPNILASRWTLWEVSFARSYGLGLVALQFPSAPLLNRIHARLPISPSAGILSASELQDTLAFVERQQVFASLARRAFFEGLVAGAASTARGKVREHGNGLLELRDRRGISSAIVSPAGRPGRLADVRTIATASAPAIPRLLLGQHRHLPESARSDLNWLAGRTAIELHGRISGYRRVQQLC